MNDKLRFRGKCSTFYVVVVVNLQFRIKLGKLEHRSQRNISWSKGEN